MQVFPTYNNQLKNVKATPAEAMPGSPPLSYIYNYVFNYTDHLGNVRLSYSKDPQTGVLEILDETHYYTFGLKHEVYVSANKKEFDLLIGGGIDGGIGEVALKEVLETEYLYKYNGIELQDELGLNMYAMDMRMYDPAIARWVVLDPVTHFEFSPYNAFDNNPVYWADPSGADAVTLTGEAAQDFITWLKQNLKGDNENDDWYFDSNDNSYKYDPHLTRDNASTRLKSGQSWAGEEVYSDNNIRGNRDGSITDLNTGKNYTGGQLLSLNGGSTIVSHTSKTRAALNYLTDNMVSPVLEGVQLIGHLLKGGVYDLPKTAIQEGRAENLHVDMDINLVGFKNGKIFIKSYSSNQRMSFEDKKNAFVKPVLSAATFPLEMTGSFLGDQILGESINRVFIDNIKEQ